MVAGVRGELLERQRVLREARAAEADSGAEEALPDPAVEPDPLGDLHDIGARRLADVRDLVDEGDPRHQRGVRRELDHLCRRDICTDDGCLDPVVQRCDRVRILLREGADHDPVGLHEVTDGRPLGRELGVGGVADVMHPACVEPVTHLLAGADGHGALHHDDDSPVERRELVYHGPDGGEIGVAGVRGGRPDCDVHEVGPVDRLCDVAW